MQIERHLPEESRETKIAYAGHRHLHPRPSPESRVLNCVLDGSLRSRARLTLRRSDVRAINQTAASANMKTGIASTCAKFSGPPRTAPAAATTRCLMSHIKEQQLSVLLSADANR